MRDKNACICSFQQLITRIGLLVCYVGGSAKRPVNSIYPSLPTKPGLIACSY